MAKSVIGRLVGSLVGLGAAAVAGAYVLGKTVANKTAEQPKPEEKEEIELIRLNGEETPSVTALDGEPEEIETVTVTPAIQKEEEKTVEEEHAAEIPVVEEKPEEPVEEPSEEVKPEEPVEEPSEEVKPEEPVEEPVEEVEPEEPADPYPNLKETKKNSILRQIDYMLETTDIEVLELSHRVKFADEDAKAAFAEKAEELGFEPGEDENDASILTLTKNTEFNREALTEEILGLANEAEGSQGSYKGWSLKVAE
ncbi:MAG: ribonuclease E inhibitor RraB [Erysipelotrichales bacterium]|nr:ribonuclease E inhibitor RraB [Erysipelotrichales bacterium]